MKTRAEKSFPAAVAFGIFGILFCIVVSMLPLIWWIQWPAVILGAVGTGWWILKYVILPSKTVPKGSFETPDDKRLCTYTVAQINTAVIQYLRSVKHPFFFNKKAIFKRPWYLLCGPAGSGKSTLLAASGRCFPPICHNDKTVGASYGNMGIAWNIAHDSVWGDIPGAMIDDSQTQHWYALIHALCQVRPRQAVDGVILVIDIQILLQSQPPELKRTAYSLRRRLDELRAVGGAEFPVYLVLNHCDAVPGFKELFSRYAEHAQEQILGAALDDAHQNIIPHKIFPQEFSLLCRSLRAVQFKTLVHEKRESHRRAICHFMILFEGMQRKLQEYITILFSPDIGEGGAVFRGFFFTGCHMTNGTIEHGASDTLQASNTVVNHPLNPRQALRPQLPPPKSTQHRKQDVYFVKALFHSVIPRGYLPVKKTYRMYRRETVRCYALIACISLILGVIGVYQFVQARKSMSLSAQIVNAVRTPSIQPHSSAQRYRILDSIGVCVAAMETGFLHNTLLTMGLGLHQGNSVYTALKREYGKHLDTCIGIPITTYLERTIDEYTKPSGMVNRRKDADLHRMLQAYLSVSEQLSTQTQLIDTLLLRPLFFEAVTAEILASENTSRLSEGMETILQRNIGYFLSILKKGEYPFLIQHNHHLVSAARKHLRRLPNASILYKSLRNTLLAVLPRLHINDIIAQPSRQTLLQSDTSISVFYTQEGWDKYVSYGITDICAHPDYGDWVVGENAHLASDQRDSSGLKQGIVDCYLDDFKEQWLFFIRSLHHIPYTTIEQCVQSLQLLSDPQSGLTEWLEKMCSLVSIDPAFVQKSGHIGIVDSLKLMPLGAAEVRKAAESFLGNKAQSGSGKPAVFEPLFCFVKSCGNTTGGLPGYRERVADLGNRLAALQAQDFDNIIDLCNGKNSDPLASLWHYTRGQLDALPGQFGSALEPLLMETITHTGTVVEKEIMQKLNMLWNKHVYSVFVDNLVNRYPFSLYNDKEAVFEDVADFFRPVTGVVWDFYNRQLRSFIMKNDTAWHVQSVQPIQLAFEPDLCIVLAQAEKISDAFFRTDGTVRTHTLALYPEKTNKHRMELRTGETHIVFTPGYHPYHARCTWQPGSECADVSMKLYTEKAPVYEYRFSGSWGLLRLFDAAHCSRITSDSFNAQWKANVQNIYTIQYTCKIVVSSDIHPFGTDMFNGFTCPPRIVEVKNYN